MIAALGKEFLTAIELLVSAGGCEAQVEGFYSEMKLQSFVGSSQSNETLVNRTIVNHVYDLHEKYNKTYEHVAQLYLEGNEHLSLEPHRQPLIMDERSKHFAKTSQVIERIGEQKPKCFFIHPDL